MSLASNPADEREDCCGVKIDKRMKEKKNECWTFVSCLRMTNWRLVRRLALQLTFLCSPRVVYVVLLNSINFYLQLFCTKEFNCDFLDCFTFFFSTFDIFYSVYNLIYSDRHHVSEKHRKKQKSELCRWLKFHEIKRKSDLRELRRSQNEHWRAALRSNHRLHTKWLPCEYDCDWIPQITAILSTELFNVSMFFLSLVGRISESFAPYRLAKSQIGSDELEGNSRCARQTRKARKLVAEEQWDWKVVRWDHRVDDTPFPHIETEQDQNIRRTAGALQHRRADDAGFVAQ